MAKQRKRSTPGETTIDRFGRVLLPKTLRDGLGLKPGDTLRLEVREGEVSLHPVKAEGAWEVRDGFPVWTGPIPAEAQDIVTFIRSRREERHLKIWKRSLGE